MRTTLILVALSCTFLHPSGELLQASEELANVRMAHTFPGIDAGQKITSAIEDLPRGGGLVDANGLAGPQTLSGITIPAGVTVKLPPITFTVAETVFVRPSGHLIGSAWGNPGHTNLVAGPTLQGDLVHALSESSTGWWHYGSIENLRVNGNPQSMGFRSCITVDRMGEASLLRNLHLSGCAESGLRINGSQAGSGRIDGVSVFDAGESAVHLNDVTSGMVINSLSSDRNPVFLKISGSRDGGVGIVLTDMKVEGTLNQADPVFWIDDSRSNVVLTIIGGTSIASSPRQDWIRVTNSGPGAHPVIQIMGTRVSRRYANLIDDMGKLVPLENTRIGHFVYGRSGTLLQVAKGESLYQDLVTFQGGPDRINFSEWRSRTNALLRSVRKSGLAVPVNGPASPEACSADLAGAEYYNIVDQQLCTCRNDGVDSAWVLQTDPTHGGHCAGG